MCTQVGFLISKATENLGSEIQSVHQNHLPCCWPLITFPRSFFHILLPSPHTTWRHYPLHSSELTSCNHTANCTASVRKGPNLPVPSDSLQKSLSAQNNMKCSSKEWHKERFLLMLMKTINCQMQVALPDTSKKTSNVYKKTCNSSRGEPLGKSAHCSGR